MLPGNVTTPFPLVVLALFRLRKLHFLPLPRIAHCTLAGVGARHAGELALEACPSGPAVQPFHLELGRRQRRVACLRCAVDDERRAGQRLERRGDAAIRIEVVRPGGAAAQREDAVRDGKGFVRAQAELAARVGHAVSDISVSDPIFGHFRQTSAIRAGWESCFGG